MYALTWESEEYQDPDLHPTDDILVLNIYDPHDLTVVYGSYLGNGSVLWHASRKP